MLSAMVTDDKGRTTGRVVDHLCVLDRSFQHAFSSFVVRALCFRSKVWLRLRLGLSFIIQVFVVTVSVVRLFSSLQ